MRGVRNTCWLVLLAVSLLWVFTGEVGVFYLYSWTWAWPEAKDLSSASDDPLKVLFLSGKSVV